MMSSGISTFRITFLPKEIITSSTKVKRIYVIKCSDKLSREQVSVSRYVPKKVKKVAKVAKGGKREHHLWKNNDSPGSSNKALSLVRIVSDLPNEKEEVYKALDKWIAWETEFPLTAAAKALQILRKRSQWIRVIQSKTMRLLFFYVRTF